LADSAEFLERQPASAAVGGKIGRERGDAFEEGLGAGLIMAPTNSMPKLTFLGLAERILREENKPLSPSEIWKTAVAKESDKKVGGSGKTPEATLYAAIFNDTRGN
jgi:hypothetical protein